MDPEVEIYEDEFLRRMRLAARSKGSKYTPHQSDREMSRRKRQQKDKQ